MVAGTGLIGFVYWTFLENSLKKLRLLCNLIFSFILKTMQALLDPKIKTPRFLKEFLVVGTGLEPATFGL